MSEQPQQANSQDINGHVAEEGRATEGERKVITVSQVSHPLVGRANPGPLGLLGFAITTFVLGLYEGGAG
jgi:hypothetical protein